MTGKAMADVDELVEAWRQIIIGDHKSSVLFAHGTCVVLVRAGAAGSQDQAQRPTVGAG